MPVEKHSGGFVKGESAVFLPKPGNPFAASLSAGAGALAMAGGPSASAATGGESDAFALPGGTLGRSCA